MTTQEKCPGIKTVPQQNNRSISRGVTWSVCLNDVEGYYTHDRPEVAREVPSGAIRILDVGCGAGRLGASLKDARSDRYVVGIEQNAKAGSEAEQVLDEVYCLDIEQDALPLPVASFDCLICADILEHLRDPWAVFQRLLACLKPGGTVIVSLPNIRNIAVVKRLLQEGRWEYEPEGILDRTHLHFFTRREFLPFLAEQQVSCHRLTYLGEASGVNLEELSLYGIAPEEIPELYAAQLMYTGTYQADATEVTFEEIVRFPLTYVTAHEDVVFSSGFSEGADNQRWLGPVALFYVPAARLVQGGMLSFLLSGSSLPFLPDPTQTIRIFYNDVPIDTVVLDDPAGCRRVCVPLNPGQRDVCIRLESSSCFKPSDSGNSSDRRALSAVISGVVISAAEDLVYGPGFYAIDKDRFWIGTDARLDISPRLLAANRSFCFRLSAPCLAQMSRSQLTVALYYNDLPIESVQLTVQNPWAKVVIPLHFSLRNAQLRIVPDASFRPSEIGTSADVRLLSVQFSEGEILT